MSCDDGHCVTCADAGDPMQVGAVDATTGLARCTDAAGAEQEVDVTLVEPVKAGAVVLVHAGVAIARLEAAA